MITRAGLQTWDESGTMTLDTSDALATILGSFDTGGSYTDSGSITDPNLALGTPFFHVAALTIPAGGNQYIGQAPQVSFSGNTVSWNWPGGSGGVSAHILYGVR